MKYITRGIEGIIKKMAKQSPALIVTGPRQSGKTTLLKHLFSKTHRYASLDNPDIRLLAAKDPELFLQSNPAPVIIDEVQYVPELFSYLKIRIDENREKKGQFLLTGSQSFPLMAGVSESLAGRISIFNLLSFSIKEQLQNKHPTLDSLKNITLRGGFPEVATQPKRDAKIWFKDYLQAYLERDIRQIRQIGKLIDFQRFLELLASLNGQVLNLSTMSRDLGVAVNTVKIWISVLETSQQVILISPYFRNKGKRIIKSPKVYFLDTGLLCFLSGISHKEQIFKGISSGQLFETVVLGEVVRGFYNRGELPRIYWWRTSHGEEVDFIIEREGKIIPLEIKLTAHTNRGLIKNLESFCRLFPDEVNKAYLVNFAKQRFTFANKLEVIPFQNFLYEL